MHLRACERRCGVASWRIARRCAAVAGLFALAAVAAATADPAVRAEPLAPRSGPPGATMFAEMPASQTGISAPNPYDDPRMWAELYQELVYGAIGTGVAAADYDGDGRPDVFIATKTGQGGLFRSLGGWRFEDVTERAGLTGGSGALAWVKSFFGDADSEAWTQGAAFADVNNDGRPDLYVCRFGAPNRLYINGGDGTFTEEAAARGLALADASGMAAFCDYDRDGWLDVYVQTNMLSASASPDGQEDRLFRNNGDGTFADVTAKAGIRGITLGHSAVWWDHDEDGWPDIYVANDYATPDRLYRNNGDGTVTDVLDRALPRTPYYSMGSDLGDVNNDGRVDFLVADMAATSHEKNMRGMASSRARAQEEPAANTTAAQRMTNALYIATGAGRFLEAAHLAGLEATDWTWSVRLEDLDCDGRLDAHFTNGMLREYHNNDLLDRIMGVESTAESRRMMQASASLAERNLAYRNLGDLRFEETGVAWGLAQNGVSFGAAFADFDGDGDLDMVIANLGGEPTVLRNDAPSGNRIVVALRGTRSNRAGIGAKVRIRTASGVQVRELSAARGYLSSSEPVAHFGLGDDAHVEELTVEWPGGGVQRFTDIAANQRLTITEPASDPEPDRVNAELQTGTARSEGGSGFGVPPSGGLFRPVPQPQLSAPEDEAPATEAQPLLPFRFDRRGPALAAADLDGDGREEIFLGGTASSPLQIQPGATLPSDGVDDGPLLLFDYDSDGDHDVLRTKSGANRTANYQPRVWRNEAGRFEPVDVLPAVSIAAGAAAAADFDRDGDLDVFIGARHEPGRYPHPPRSVLLSNGAGLFVDATPDAIRTAGMVTAALWTDLDVDGWPDLLVATEWGPVRAFLNERGTLRERTDLGFGIAGLWTSLAAADFNGDGRPDIVAGNIGLNTPYRAPAILYAGDFRGGGGSQIVEAHVEDGRLLPRRTRQELGSQIPQVLRKFPKNDAYARATLEEIIGERLAGATRLEAIELRSGVFLSRPDGTWRFADLPRIVQVAPLQGLAIADFSGDGRTDIFAVQNSFAPATSTGRFDGGAGQLLLGDGAGNFAAVPPAESGLVVPGDAKALLTLDLNGDGWPDLLASRNNESTLAFEHRGVDGSRSFRVVLKGERGNPAAIGAALTLELADGSTQRVELHAGSGYQTQNPRGAFFAYPAANPPRRLTVRWPDGRTTTHAFDELPRELLRIGW